MPNSNLSLLAILAHPDDESLGLGGIFARYHAEGVRTHLITATRGQRGWTGDPAAYPGPEALGQIREGELKAAAAHLGIDTLILLDYMDGDLDRANPSAIIAELTAHIRALRPQVVITFDSNGAYGHPDHIAICQFTQAALVAAADAHHQSSDSPHRVDKLYYLAQPESLLTAYEELFGDLVMNIDGVERRPVLWKEWAITTRVECPAHLDTVLDAIGAHRSQLPAYDEMRRQHTDALREIWGVQSLYRVYSFVNGGRAPENDIFEGLRAQ